MCFHRLGEDEGYDTRQSDVNALRLGSPDRGSRLLTAPAFAWDDEAQLYFERHPHQNWADIGRVMGGGIAIGGLTVGLFSAGRFANPDRLRASTYDFRCSARTRSVGARSSLANG